MKFCRMAAALVLAIGPGAALAEGRVTLGWGRLFDNDAIGDGQDRWHSGSYSVSILRGTEWTGALPENLGQIVEWRFRADTIAPSNLIDPDPADRRYAGSVSLGLHSQVIWQGLEVNLGADMVAIGPQTGISDFQKRVHGIVGMGKPDTSNQIGNAIRPTVMAELGRSFDLGPDIAFRPFVAGQAGVETLVRLGGDLAIGHFGQRSVMLRDDVTGQRYRAVAAALEPGLSLTLGGDVARVFASAYLPADGAVVASNSRTRLRAGVHWQGSLAAVFFGMTYLSPEYAGQKDGQVVGSLNLSLRF